MIIIIVNLLFTITIINLLLLVYRLSGVPLGK